MKASYNREEDVLMIETSDEAIDYAEEMGSIIVHFSAKNRPVLLEILDASEFISTITRTTIKAQREEFQEI